jgi:hypothetical protein
MAANKSFKVKESVTLTPNASTSNAEGEIRADSASHRLTYHNGTTEKDIAFTDDSPLTPGSSDNVVATWDSGTSIWGPNDPSVSIRTDFGTAVIQNPDNSTTGSTDPLRIQTGAILNSDTSVNSGSFYVTTGIANGTDQYSGQVNIRTGQSNSDGQTSGQISIATGSNLGALGYSGDVYLQTSGSNGTGSIYLESGYATGQTSGQVFIKSGGAGGSSDTGNLIFNSGDNSGTGASGAVQLLTGASVSSTSGDILANTGTVSSGSLPSGSASIITGEQQGTGNTGSISLQTGISTGGNSGDVNIGTGAAASGTPGRVKLTSPLATVTVTNSSLTGTSAVLTPLASSHIRLTNGSLVSIAKILEGTSGQKLTISNVTGNSITIINDSAGLPVSRRVYTGTGADLTLANNASIDLIYDTTTTYWRVIGGTGAATSGTGIKNYITNGTFEDGTTTGWGLGDTTLNSGLPDTPTFNSGAGVSITLAATATNPLSGDYSAVIDAASTLSSGNMFHTDEITLDLSDRSRILSWGFNYKQTAGTALNFSGTSNNNYGVAIYDVTNSAFIIPAGVFNLVQGTGVGRATGTFQVPSNTATIRFVIYVANAAGTASTMYFDDIVLGPQITVNAPAMSDWTAYTPTFTGFGTVTGVNTFYRRVGDSIQISSSFVLGTPTAVEGRLSLPAGVISADSTKIGTLMNSGTYVRSGANTNKGGLVYIEPSVGYVTFSDAAVIGGTSVNPVAKVLGSAVGVSGETIILNATVPISGWSSNSVMSQDTDTRVVSFAGTQTSQALTAGTTNMTLAITKDSHGAWATNIYTVPVAGDYFASASFISSGTTSVIIYKNGALFSYGSTAAGAGNASQVAALLTNLVPGDTISFRAGNSITATDGDGSIFRLSGPAVVAASEKIYLQYTGNAGTALTANTTNIDFATKVVDSHNAWNGTTFTAPRSDFYIINGAALVTVAGTQGIQAYVNTVQKILLSGTDSSSVARGLSGSVYLNAGEALTFRSDAAKTLSNSAVAHWISISSKG